MYDPINLQTCKKKLLLKEYFELNATERKVVYSTLKLPRKKWIDEALLDPKEMEKLFISRVMSLYREYFGIDIPPTSVRSYDELAAMHAILFTVPIYESDTSEYGMNRGREEEMFYHSRKMMIEQLKKMNVRKRDLAEDPLIEELAKRKFIKHKPHKEYKNGRDAYWNILVEDLLEDKERGRKILKECTALKNRIERGLSKNEKIAHNKKIKKINAYFRSSKKFEIFWLRATSIVLDAEDKVFMQK